MSGSISPTGAIGAIRSSGWRIPVCYSRVGRIVLWIDVLLIAAASVGTGVGYHTLALGTSGDLGAFMGVGAVVAALFVPCLCLRGLYERRAIQEAVANLPQVLLTWIGALLFLAGVAFSLKMGGDFSRGAVLTFAVAGAALLSFHRVAWQLALKSDRVSARFRAKSVIVVTHSSHDDDRSQLFSDLRSSGHQVLRRIDLSGESEAQLKVELSIALQGVRGSDAEGIFLALPLQLLSDGLLRGLMSSPLPVQLIPQGRGAELLSKPAVALGSFNAVEIKRAPLDEMEQLTKRALDILCSLFGLFVLSPLLAATALAIRLDTPGPVLFRQTRLGFNGRPFRIYKFRSMTVLEDGATVQQACRGDARVTRVGYWLRRLSIDELPQLINVLRGEMSIVGPRPHAVAHDNHYNQLISKYAFRHHVKPGLTGLAQVNGYRGETPEVELMARRVEYDIRYIDTWSLFLDVSIILRTTLELVRSRRAY